MARAEIARTEVPIDGVDLIALTYETMATGDGNGVECPYRPGDLIVMYNTTASPATYTVKVAQPSTFSTYELTVPDLDVAVADGELMIVPVAAIFRQTDGNLYVDCDVAADIAVLAMS